MGLSCLRIAPLPGSWSCQGLLLLLLLPALHRSSPLSASRCGCPSPPSPPSQILFKDLFRFLLVYVLFMIGYASGETSLARGGGALLWSIIPCARPAPD